MTGTLDMLEGSFFLMLCCSEVPVRIDLWWSYPELHPGAEISKGVMVNFILLRG